MVKSAFPKVTSNPNAPTEATSAGGLVFYGGEDGKARAVDATKGELRWTFPTAGIVKYPPSIADGRAYFGSGDGRIIVSLMDGGLVGFGRKTERAGL